VFQKSVNATANANANANATANANANANANASSSNLLLSSSSCCRSLLLQTEADADADPASCASSASLELKPMNDSHQTHQWRTLKSTPNTQTPSTQHWSTITSLLACYEPQATSTQSCTHAAATAMAYDKYVLPPIIIKRSQSVMVMSSSSRDVTTSMMSSQLFNQTGLMHSQTLTLQQQQTYTSISTYSHSPRATPASIVV
jgi:hypothetical protein